MENYNRILDLSIDQLLKLDTDNKAEIEKSKMILSHFGINLEKDVDNKILKYCKRKYLLNKLKGYERDCWINKTISEIKAQEPLVRQNIEKNNNHNLFLQKEYDKYMTSSYKESVDFEKDDGLLCKIKKSVSDCNTTMNNEEIINDLIEIEELDKEIKTVRHSIQEIKEELKKYHGLPPNISEAKRKLNKYKKDYNKSCGEFYKNIWHD